jgi:hypothetical protein
LTIFALGTKNAVRTGRGTAAESAAQLAAQINNSACLTL